MSVEASGYDWNDLKYFLACCRAGSLGAAGRKLRVNQTTVGRRLLALEHSLGSRLFDRTPGGFVPTVAGESLLEVAAAVEQAAIDFERRATGEDTRLEGVVRVATTETIAATFLVREAVTLHREHPRIELEVVTGIGATNLLKREADLALRAGSRPSQQSVVARRLGAIAWGAFAAPAYLKRRPFKEGRLDEHEVVGFCDDLVQSPGGRWLAENGAAGHEVFRTNNLFTAAEAARSGWGLTVLPVFLGEATGGLARAGRKALVLTDLWLIVHPELQRNGRVRAVIEHLAAAVKRAGALAKE